MTLYAIIATIFIAGVGIVFAITEQEIIYLVMATAVWVVFVGLPPSIRSTFDNMHEQETKRSQAFYDCIDRVDDYRWCGEIIGWPK